MEDVNFDKHRQRKKDNEKLENKRRISLCNISKIFEEIIVNRLNKHLNFTGAQAGARPQKSTFNILFTLKSIIQQRKREWKETYVAFIGVMQLYICCGTGESKKNYGGS